MHLLPELHLLSPTISSSASAARCDRKLIRLRALISQEKESLILVLKKLKS